MNGGRILAEILDEYSTNVGQMLQDCEKIVSPSSLDGEGGW